VSLLAVIPHLHHIHLFNFSMSNRPNHWTCDDENPGSLSMSLLFSPHSHLSLLAPNTSSLMVRVQSYTQPHSQQIANDVFPVNNHLAAGMLTFHEV